MAIVFTCACGKPLKAKDEAAGKRTKCPHCAAVVTVPAVEKAAAGEPATGPTPAVSADADLPLDIGESSVRIEPLSSASLDVVQTAPSGQELETAATDGRTRQYKVLTPKDMGFFAKFDAVKLEETLNSWSKQGWTLRTAVVQTHTSHSGTHHDLLVIMER